MSTFDGRGRAPHTVVVGLQYGDEGKGQVVDWLADDYDVVVRFNGGANAGHSVEVAGERFALHLVPSGIVRPGILNLITGGTALDPFLLANEIDQLRARGVEVDGNLRIAATAHLVLPWHREQERRLEALAGGAAIGTTGRGIGPCYADKALRVTAVRAEVLLDEGTLRRRIAEVAPIKEAMLSGLDVAPNRLSDELAAVAERLRPFIGDVTPLLRDALASRRVLFEGAHSSLLDVDHGTYPFVTSSHCTALGVHSGAGVPARAIGRVIGVVKAYTSRVGAGPFPTEITGAPAERLREHGGEYGTSTGRPRRVGWLDVPAVREAVELNGVDGIVLTGLGVLAGLDDAPDPLPAGIDRCRRYADLPAEARALVERLSRDIAPVIAVCVGRGREAVMPIE